VWSYIKFDYCNTKWRKVRCHVFSKLNKRLRRHNSESKHSSRFAIKSFRNVSTWCDILVWFMAKTKWDENLANRQRGASALIMRKRWMNSRVNANECKDPRSSDAIPKRDRSLHLSNTLRNQSLVDNDIVTEYVSTLYIDI